MDNLLEFIKFIKISNVIKKASYSNGAFYIKGKILPMVC